MNVCVCQIAQYGFVHNFADLYDNIAHTTWQATSRFTVSKMTAIPLLECGTIAIAIKETKVSVSAIIVHLVAC